MRSDYSETVWMTLLLKIVMVKLVFFQCIRSTFKACQQSIPRYHMVLGCGLGSEGGRNDLHTAPIYICVVYNRHEQ